MKVHELIEFLTGFEQNAEVYLACDEEGNDFSPLIDVEENISDTVGIVKDDLVVTLWP